MAETLVKNPTCSKCGEDARPQALFCHACGGEIVDLPQDEDGDVSSAWFKEDIVDVVESADNSTAAAAERKKIEFEQSDLIEEGALEDSRPQRTGETLETSETAVKVRRTEQADEDDARTVVKKKKKLTSAAEIRRKPKAFRPKRVEIVWEENSNSPNLMFLVFGLLIATAAGVFLFLAYYLK